MSVESIYPAGPSEVPANLTKATAKYRQHAWLAAFYASLSSQKQIITN